MRKIAILLLGCLCINAVGQIKALSSSEILQGLEKLNTVGNVMYLAAHPDDENTLLIAWLSKEKKVRTAYMAMTRGDGGQNLIGSEQGENVGLLRTHELLEARKIDGGEQFFSRAKDFGFTKKTEEAMATWGKDKILADVVYQIRKFQPDIIITRFPPDERAGHGHHSASAILAAEAFDAAADETKFTDQLKTVKTWQVKRLVWNTFNRGFTNTAPTDSGKYVKIPLGEFNKLLGKSYPEIAAEARSKHRSQGFGSAPSRNERYDYALHVKGQAANNDLFDGIDLTWNRIIGGQIIATSLNEIIKDFDVKDPAKSVKELLKVYQEISKLPESVYTESKKKECINLILSCAGIYLEANAASNTSSPGQKLKIFTTATSRSNLNVKLNNVQINGVAQKDTLFNQTLGYNKALEGAFEIQVPKNALITQPYWLWEKPELGFFKISNESYRGQPMAPEALNATFKLTIEGQDINYTAPITFKYTEPSRGEIYRYLEIRPEIMVNLDQKVYVFADGKAKQIGVNVKTNIANNKASVSLKIPAGWKVSPSSIEVELKEKNQEKQVFFDLTPSTAMTDAEIFASATNENGSYERGLSTISYEHIPELNSFPIASAKVNRIDLIKSGKNIGYIAGTGDEVPAALKQIGYEIQYITANNIKTDLSKFDAIIVGVRAYNTEDWLVNAQSNLLDYVKNGGNLIVQYQTQAFFGKLKTNDLGPYPFTIGRGRVTDENAEVKFLKPSNSLLNYPNKITEKDFQGWVQERGLYFAEAWSDKYETIFAMKDAGETLQEGALLYTKYGKGNYIFTGLAFFRQLPAGVTGAYRIMANLISMKK